MEKDYQISNLEIEIKDIKKVVKDHEKRLNLHDITFAEHTKDFEKLTDSISRLTKTMEDFILEIRQLKNAPLESAKHYRRLIFSTIITASLGVLLGVIFSQGGI